MGKEKEEYWCPKCEEDVMVNVPWGSVKCPKCGLKGYWEEDYLPDFTDCWGYVEWEEIDKN